jgi:Ser/Thr protein kinase RdoA (MazF antagonist)
VRLRPDLRAPDLRHRAERPDGTVALWLEEVPEPERWTPARLGAFANRLGRMQAAAAVDPPEETWLSRGFLREYLCLHAVRDENGVLDRLERLPHTLAHNDLHPANVLGEDASVVVDWAYCGLAPLGLDPGVLVADGVADSLIRPEEAAAAGDAVWEAYASGLRAAGFDQDLATIRWAFLAGTALRLSWLDPDQPRDEQTRDAWRAAGALIERWREAARGIPSGG